MEPLDNPKDWVPYYVNSKDCSQGFCNLYCPQWCYNIFPPPPFEFTYDNSSPKLSPLVIAIIGIFASAALLVSYYTIISKYCGNTTRREIEDVASEELEHNHNPSFHDQYEPWHVPTRGLDEALIKSITVCKYKKGDDLIEVTDCSVCLSEFEEDECIRLLPKCNHAFHVPCIDPWLKSHSNCPLCRANIFFISVAQSPPQLPPTLTDHHQTPQTQGTSENEGADHEEEEDIERGINVAEGEILLMNNEIPRTPFRAFSFSDLGNLQGKDTMIEIADEGYNQQIRRSVSMDHASQSFVSVADIIEEKEWPLDAGSSKQSTEIGKSSHRYKLMNMHCSNNQVTLKRSFTSRRFSLLSRQSRLRDTIIPL